MTQIQVLKNTKKASTNDLNRLLKCVQKLLDAQGNTVWDLFKKAPIAIQVYCQEHGFHRESLTRLRDEIKISLQ
jgi:hypothetical protein